MQCHKMTVLIGKVRRGEDEEDWKRIGHVNERASVVKGTGEDS